ncbi:isochorismatase family protein [Nocardiopsis sp. N85]|uniref:isochorismatase family protein n=1 Tax=Nocardiopsis sp. N85 TaxID=3029400 RepID=UPI00237F2F85|nr:isochorismatase family protein [Nocardiopsis sp. N85]MDE3723786.1 isochorismatase family protein [Nocardiopsis sp. N85]
MPGIPPIRNYPMPTADALPDNVARWDLDPDRAVLLVHDMQRFFLRPFATTEEPYGTLLKNCALLREHAVRAGARVAYTAQPGRMTPGERGLLRDFWGPGMTTSVEDREVVEPLTPGPDDWMFTKWRYSAFHRSDLLERMRAEGRDQLVLCGVYAHVGVLMTGVDAFSHDIRVFLAADAVADFDAEHHRLALEYAATRCAVVAPTERLLDRMTVPGADRSPVEVEEER